MFWRAVICFSAISFVGVNSDLNADEISESIKILQNVQPGGKGTSVARQAVDHLAMAGEPAMLPTLKGFSDSNPLAVNWLRNAFEEIVRAQLQVGKSLPAEALEAFVLDRSQSPTARRLAYETLKVQNAELEARLIPEMLLDPSPEFRRDAVARLIAEAGKAGDAAAATPLFQKALSGAVHEDQVKEIAEALRKNGATVDVQKHFGFLPKWMIAGPFDNKEEKGFALTYAPEEQAAAGTPLDVAAEYDGQSGKVKWLPVTTEDDYGVVDIAKQIENFKGSVMYATTTWDSADDQQVEVRLGTPNAWKLWVNGKQVFEREEYHRSSAVDQYKVPVTLKAGVNVLLLKICQNEQTQEWAQRYQFQLRICDSTGSAVLPKMVTAQNERQSGETR
jgi:hypothetical protein